MVTTHNYNIHIYNYIHAQISIDKHKCICFYIGLCIYLNTRNIMYRLYVIISQSINQKFIGIKHQKVKFKAKACL